MPTLPHFLRHNVEDRPLRGVGVPLLLRPSLASRTARSFLASTSKSWFEDISPVLIDDNIFTNWPPAQQGHTTIRKLELRKERDHFKHEFVAIYPDDLGQRVHRIDRRPLGGPTAEAIFAKGCDAEDSITPVMDEELAIIQRDTDCKIEVEFHFNPKPDLYTVLVICDTIRKDPQTKKYTLQQFNCYFVARAIMTLITRNYLLQHSSSDLRWYAISESSISKHIFRDDWGNLDKAMKDAVITILVKVLWPIIRMDAEPLVKEKSHWKKLEADVERIIRTMVEEGNMNVVDESLKRSVFPWVLEAARDTLWHEDLERNLLNQQKKENYGLLARLTLRETMKTGLEQRLPDGIGARLPKRLLHRLPPSLLASLPAELMARFPSHFLDKLPDEVVQNIADTHMEKAPDAYLSALSTPLFERTPTRVVLRLPEDLRRVPQRLLDVSLRRIRTVLEDPIPSEECYKPLALKLLKRLPEDLLGQLPPKFKDIRARITVDDIEPTSATPAIGDPSISTVTQPAKPSPLDYFIRLAPAALHKRMPPIVAEMFPTSWIKNLSSEAVALLPPERIAKFRPRLLARLPRELLERIPESMLKKLPREMLERLPDELLQKLPIQLLKNIPNELLSNLPENITDLLRDAIASETFERDGLREELVKNAGSVVMEALKRSSDKPLESIMKISLGDPSDVRHSDSE